MPVDGSIDKESSLLSRHLDSSTSQELCFNLHIDQRCQILHTRSARTHMNCHVSQYNLLCNILFVQCWTSIRAIDIWTNWCIFTWSVQPSNNIGTFVAIDIGCISKHECELNPISINNFEVYYKRICLTGLTTSFVATLSSIHPWIRTRISFRSYNRACKIKYIF